MGIDEIQSIFSEKQVAEYLVMYMRMVTSCYVKMNDWMFVDYLEGLSVDMFCT